MEGKSTMNMYKLKEKPNAESFYDGSWNGTLLFKARTRSLEVKCRTYRWDPDNSKMCRACNQEEESLEHFMVVCSAYEGIRREFVADIKGVVGVTDWEIIKNRDYHGLGYILALDRDVKPGVVELTKKYLGRLWAARQTLCERAT